MVPECSTVTMRDSNFARSRNPDDQVVESLWAPRDLAGPRPASAALRAVEIGLPPDFESRLAYHSGLELRKISKSGRSGVRVPLGSARPGRPRGRPAPPCGRSKSGYRPISSLASLRGAGRVASRMRPAAAMHTRAPETAPAPDAAVPAGVGRRPGRIFAASPGQAGNPTPRASLWRADRAVTMERVRMPIARDGLAASRLGP